jgi:hypothetical protein
MKLTRLLALAVFALPVLAHAHPGHDGPELTWDFDHLAAHPAATLLCILLGGAIVWTGWHLLRARQTRHHPVRRQPADRR